MIRPVFAGATPKPQPAPGTQPEKVDQRDTFFPPSFAKQDEQVAPPIKTASPEHKSKLLKDLLDDLLHTFSTQVINIHSFSNSGTPVNRGGSFYIGSLNIGGKNYKMEGYVSEFTDKVTRFKLTRANSDITVEMALNGFGMSTMTYKNPEKGIHITDCQHTYTKNAKQLGRVLYQLMKNYNTFNKTEVRYQEVLLDSIKKLEY